MNDEILQVIIATYNNEEFANQALEALIQATKDGEIDIKDAALIEKYSDGKIHVKDTADVSTGRGAAIGGLIGGVVGLIAGPAGVVILGGAGAIVGGALTSGDEGIPDDRLYKLGESLEASTTAVVAIVKPAWVGEVKGQLAASSEKITTVELSADASSKLKDNQ